MGEEGRIEEGGGRKEEEERASKTARMRDCFDRQ